MKVLTIGTDIQLFTTGSPVQTRVQEYAARMEELHVIVFSLQSKPCAPIQIGNLYVYPTNSRSKLWWVWDGYRLGKKIVAGHGFVRGASVISAQDPFECGLSAYLISRAFTLPLQLQIHTDFLSPYFKNSFLNRVRVVIARYIVPQTKGIRAVSQGIVDSIKKSFSSLPQSFFDRVSVLPIFVDVEALTARQTQRDIRADYPQFTFTIFMASRLTAEKNIESALYVLKEILKTFPKTGLIIAGDGTEKIKLVALCATLGITDNVIFVGWQTDLVSYLKSCHVFLSTSLYEGYGMVLIEAGACGIPIVTTRTGIAGQLCRDGENAFVCSVGDVGCLTNGVINLIKDNSLRELFKRAMRDSITAVALTREQYVAQYIDLLEKLV